MKPAEQTSVDLVEKVAFDRLVSAPDGHGGTETEWSAESAAVVRRANFRYLRGGEAVLASRLASRQPVVAMVRSDSQTRQIKPSWRMRDLRTGAVFAIRSIVPSEDRRFIEITAETGSGVSP